VVKEGGIGNGQVNASASCLGEYAQQRVVVLVGSWGKEQVEAVNYLGWMLVGGSAVLGST
jgi:hypothetical protein